MLTYFRVLGLVLGVFLAVSQAPGTARASLIGDEINVAIVVPNLSFNKNGTTTVAADSSDAFFLANSFLRFAIDPFASGVVVTLLDVFDAGGFIFGVNSTIQITDLDWTDAPGEVVGVSIGAASTFSFGNGTTSYTSDSAGITSTGNNSWSVGQFLTIDIESIHTVVPEPGTLTLFGAGLFMLGLLRRRRRVV